MEIAQWNRSEVETLLLHCHAVIQHCHCLQGRLSFKCMWHGAITPFISFYPPPPHFSLSNSLFPSSSFAPQISSFVWKVTKQPRTIMLCELLSPPFLRPPPSPPLSTWASISLHSSQAIAIYTCPLSSNDFLFSWHVSCSSLFSENHIIGRAPSYYIHCNVNQLSWGKDINTVPSSTCRFCHPLSAVFCVLKRDVETSAPT